MQKHQKKLLPIVQILYGLFCFISFTLVHLYNIDFFGIICDKMVILWKTYVVFLSLGNTNVIYSHLLSKSI